MNQIKIGWLFPDTLYLHGERGNILALERFCKKAGFEPVITRVEFETEGFTPMDYDIIFCPPGEIVSYPVILQWLLPYREDFAQFVAAGKVLVATGTSVALWCETVKRTDGSTFSGMGLLSAEAVENRVVYGDDNLFACTYNGKSMEILGNQIQMADFINKGETTFGQLLYGYGNTGKDRNEGFMKNNSVFTNALGPVLVTNPWLTVSIIEAAAEAKGYKAEWMDCDFQLEQQSFATKKEFIQSKETRLTNCKAQDQ